MATQRHPIKGSGMTSSCYAGAAADDAPGPGPPACSGSVQLTSPQQFSTSNDADSPSRFDTQCLYGGYVKGFSIAPAIAVDPVNNRVFSVQGSCSDGSTTDNITLTTDDQCQSTYTAGPAKYVPSDSTPAAFWNTYYRWDPTLSSAPCLDCALCTEQLFHTGSTRI